MASIVRFPAVVEEALKHFGPLFGNEPQRQHLGEYLTGLISARNKNVSGIAREFLHGPDQSCLNRFLGEAPWDDEQLNRLRLEWVQQDPQLRYHRKGVIAIDNVLFAHSGEQIADVGWFWDHTDQRYLVAHDYVLAQYVAPSGKHYPLEFRRFVKRQQCQEQARPFQNHEQLLRELADGCIQEQIPGTFTFDSWFSCPENLEHLHHRHRAYVGELKGNRHLLYRGQELRAIDLAHRIAPEAKRSTGEQRDPQWYFTCRIRLPKVDHPLRLVILWGQREDIEPVKLLVSNQTRWEVHRMRKVYRARWRGCECFHRDGKQDLGMGDCQMRDALGQTRHMYLVFLSYTLLMRVLGQPCAWAQAKLTTIGEASRAVWRETMRDLLSWVAAHLQNDHWSLQHIEQELQLT